MIIKMIPETAEERSRYERKGIAEVEHHGVREFMLFGTKVDAEGDLADFHEWHGAYRYLMGSLNYFYETINDNRRNQGEKPQLALADAPSGMIKRGDVMTDLKTLDLSKLESKEEDAEVEEVGAFEEEEAQAVEVEEVNVDKEDLAKQAEQIDNTDGSNPQGLRIVKD
jgi:hypothetical protein